MGVIANYLSEFRVCDSAFCLALLLLAGNAQAVPPMSGQGCKADYAIETSELLSTYERFYELQSESSQRCVAISSVPKCMQESARYMREAIFPEPLVNEANQLLAMARIALGNYMLTLSSLSDSRKGSLPLMEQLISNTELDMGIPKSNVVYGLRPEFFSSILSEGATDWTAILSKMDSESNPKNKVYVQGMSMLLEHGDAGRLMFGYLLIRSLAQILSPRFFFLNGSFEYHPANKLIQCLLDTRDFRVTEWDQACVASSTKSLASGPGTIYGEAKQFESKIRMNPFVGYKVPFRLEPALGQCSQGQLENAFLDWVANYVYFKFFLNVYREAYSLENVVEVGRRSLMTLHCTDEMILNDESLKGRNFLAQLYESLSDRSATPIVTRMAMIDWYFDRQDNASYSRADELAGCR